MAVTNGMFIFEVVVENVKSMVESRVLVIKGDFANIFSLQLKDPKHLHIVMPEPLPLPAEPVGKKGKKKKKKPKPKKGKKGKKGKKPKIEAPPPEPLIQSGQSVLFCSSAEVLIENMKNNPLELSLWSKEEDLIFIGSTRIPWDPIFILYLEKIANCQEPPPVTLNDEYNIFEEGKAKLMAKISIQVKLSYLTSKVTTSFRTLSEDPTVRKCLYTGINSKDTSYICTLKTSDELYIKNSNKIENSFIVDKPPTKTKIAYADYKNAPGANLTFFKDSEYCCMAHADKPPDPIYKAHETCPDIDFIVDYVRKIIVSCNDNMRMLTPRPTIAPRIKATDIDKYCYCRETQWPKGKFAERFRLEAQSGPCPQCIDTGKLPLGGARSHGATFDLANIRGPCGSHECRIARDMRAYIENLVEEDNQTFNLDDLIGPCGSKDCTLAEKIMDFLTRKGVFSQGATLEGLSTQCACIEKMRLSLTERSSCSSVCSKDCSDSGSDTEICGGDGCPYKKTPMKVYDVYYFTVEYDYEKKTDSDPGNESDTAKSFKSSKSSKFQYCPPSCPSSKPSERTSCSRTVCSTGSKLDDDEDNSKCKSPVCPSKQSVPPSPADSHIEIKLDEIHNPCCVKTCDIADRVKDFIVEGVTKKKKRPRDKCELDSDDPCYCDCVCTFKFSSKTTYCAVCGGYECLGDDMRDKPAYIKPHPCPVYHKLYDKKYIKTKSPWPEVVAEKEKSIGKENNTVKEIPSVKHSKTGSGKGGPVVSDKKPTSSRSMKDVTEKAVVKKEKKVAEIKVKKPQQGMKKVGKFTANEAGEPAQGPVVKKVNRHILCTRSSFPPVPRNMGWNWRADDIPGMKHRPKWKPGAVHKLLVRKYKSVREGMDIINKKKRALLQRKKKIEMKPTLIVTKHEGEYTVQMEVFKKYSKERLLFQYPYDEKPPQIYTIGKTEEEKRKIQKQRDRRERRETRRKNRLLQSTFRDKCQEICLKAYNQAIGLLPLPNPNDPDCPCHTQPAPNYEPPIVDSCSCSDIGTISTSDTDNDEWVIEFTPPAARWDVKAKHPPNLSENESQYNYLDYKVKLFDKTGNPLPRYFKGPDGKQECSDLGGFWSPTHHWLEINKDGYIGPDKRWVPMNFTGPDGLFYSADEGFFQDSTGQIYKIGIDGYVDKDGKWVMYKNNKAAKSTRSKSTATASTCEPKNGGRSTVDSSKVKAQDPKGQKPVIDRDRKSNTPGTTVTVAKGKKKVQVNEKAKNPLVMSVSVDYARNRLPRQPPRGRETRLDQMRLRKYREIIEELRAYDDLGDIKLPPKSNRASNTPRKKVSPFTMHGLLDNFDKKRSLQVETSGRTSNLSTPCCSRMARSGSKSNAD